jgi:RNA polymerase sigma-70 factor (ECF subfamily)
VPVARKLQRLGLLAEIATCRDPRSQTLQADRMTIPNPDRPVSWMKHTQMRIEAETPRLWRYALALTRNHLEAEDLVQDCLARALSRVHLWEDGTDLRAWLFTILHNQYINRVRTAAHQGKNVGLPEDEPLLTRAATQGVSLELRDLHRALGRISDSHRIVVLLVGLEGMRYQDIADLLSIPVGTVRSRLSRGRAELRRLMGLTESRHGKYAA